MSIQSADMAEQAAIEEKVYAQKQVLEAEFQLQQAQKTVEEAVLERDRAKETFQHFNNLKKMNPKNKQIEDNLTKAKNKLNECQKWVETAISTRMKARKSLKEAVKEMEETRRLATQKGEK